MIFEIKKSFKTLIDTLLTAKKGIFKESQKIDQCVERMRSQLSLEQTAKFLILMEKFKAKEEFSVFNLWNLKKKDEVGPKKESQKDELVSVMDLQEKGDEDQDVDMDLPNDEEDMHKIIQKRRVPPKSNLYEDNSNNSLTSSQQLKLNRSLDSKTRLIPQSPGLNHVAFVDGKFVTLGEMSGGSKKSISQYHKVASNNSLLSEL